MEEETTKVEENDISSHALEAFHDAGFFVKSAHGLAHH